MFFNKQPPAPDSVDTSTKRSLEIRSRNEDHFLVDYFYHLGEFWTAKIPLAVAHICGQSFNFSTIRTKRGQDGTEVVIDDRGQPKPKYAWVNHLQSRFQLATNHWVELYPLGSEPTDQPSHRINDFVYSVEAAGPPGMEFDFRSGMAGCLLCMHRFLSTQEMVFEKVVVFGQYVWESPSLPITEKEKSVVLRNSLERSHRAGLKEVYYLYRCCGTNNCTSNPFQIVDQSVHYNFWQRLGSFAYRLPLNPRLYLRMRGLDADPSRNKLVRADFEDFIARPETQQRKRNVVRAAIRKKREMRSTA